MNELMDILVSYVCKDMYSRFVISIVKVCFNNLCFNCELDVLWQGLIESCSSFI